MSGVKNGFRLVLKVFLYISFAWYALMLVYVLFVYFHGYWTDISLWDCIRYNTNFVPFRSITMYINALFDQSMNIETPVMNLFGNLLMFLPMGLYLPSFFQRLRKLGTFCACMLCMLFVVEAVQLLIRRGSFDIDDVILNMAGALGGFAVYRCITRWRRNAVGQEPRTYGKGLD